MLGHHPITGQPIKILKTETHIYKDQKTLIWLRNVDDVKKGYARYYKTVITDLELVKHCSPYIYIFVKPSLELYEWLKNEAPRTKCLIFLSKDVINMFGTKDFYHYAFDNVICLEDYNEIYSYIELNYSVSTDIESIVAAVGTLLRMKDIYGFLPNDSTLWTEFRHFLKNTFGLACYETEKVVPKCWLIQQYYVPPQAKRAREIKKCLDKNIENPFIHHILLLNEKKEVLPTSDKLKEIVIGRRLTYKDVMETIVSHVDIDTNDYVIFANSDIYFDETLSHLWDLNMENKFLSLLRYEEDTQQLFGPRSDSQDSWIVSASAIKSRSQMSSWKWDEFEFPFGKSGCDNALNIAMLRSKFLVANPCISIKSWHVHTSAIRTYDPKDVIEKPFFLYVDPTGIHDLQPRQFSSGEVGLWSKDTVFSRNISTSEKQAPIFYTMLSRDNYWNYNSGSSNMYTPIQEKLYTIQNAFMTPKGFVYNYNSLVLGNNSFLKEECSKEFISHLTPSYCVDSLLAVPLSQEASSNIYSYVVEYISKILRLRKAGYKGSFWMPRDSKFDDILQKFTWNENVMPVLPLDDDTVGFGKTIHMLVPSESRSEFVVHKEDIMALREAYSSWNKQPSENMATILLDGVLFKEEDIPIYQEIFKGMLFILRPHELLDGCRLFLCAHGFKNMFWMLPVGAKVVEFQKDLDIQGDSAHMAGACDLEYRVVLYSRGQKILKELEEFAAVQEKEINYLNLMKKREDDFLPTIIIPRGFEGFHGHTGDSFREMAALWSERGYCYIEQRGDTPFCWFESVGNVLLYDRPTWQWFHDKKPAYEKILCGNPEPQEPATHAWSFWPRRPKLVELLVIEGVHEAEYKERSKNLVFYGRVENNIQKTRRENKLPEACDDFFMPMAVGKEVPYKYSHDEYLRRLADARFGLCLAGFGRKCHREIECMAMGTVPVVAPDVDMTHYAEKPVEGVHYLRLQSFDPAEALSCISKIDETQWKTLSENAHSWWLQNCSAEGMWKLTKSLV